MGIDRVVRALFGRHGWLLLGTALVCALLLAALTPVPADRIGLVLRLGRPVRVIDGRDGASPPVWHIPLIDQVVWLDRRAMTLPLVNLPVTAGAGQAQVADAYAVWRVTDPVQFYARLGTPDHATATLRPMLAAAIQQQLAARDHDTGDHTGDSAGDSDGKGAGDCVRRALNRALAGYGARISDVGVSRLTLPDGAPLDAAYAQMAANADAEAAAIAAQGHRAAQLIRAEGQASAGQIYAASFGKDPEFYDFYRAMQSYDGTFAQKPGRTAIVLSPDNAYLRQFRGK